MRISSGNSTLLLFRFGNRHANEGARTFYRQMLAYLSIPLLGIPAFGAVSTSFVAESSASMRMRTDEHSITESCHTLPFLILFFLQWKEIIRIARYFQQI
ncbi:hypothetical protein KP509_12G087700 [Ceratopteris richardii]|uniref:Uncharacterized protein n=1 Tax=Ceratopteris richardii TaxID=49495 RepID=A0A8T2TL46_CERRI|nr:hypothetical protein KP509_12G087700 [Ceratopteris richardii]